MFICFIFTIFFPSSPISLYYCLYFLRLALVLSLISLCTAELPADFSQGGSIKEHLNLNFNQVYTCEHSVCVAQKEIPGSLQLAYTMYVYQRARKTKKQRPTNKKKKREKARWPCTVLPIQPLINNKTIGSWHQNTYRI